MFFRVVRHLPACAIVCGAALFSLSSLADTSVFTALDDPATAKKSFDGNVQAGYSAQTGNTSNSSLSADSTMTWFQTNTAYSLWGSARNASSSGVRSSEKYQAGGRSRYNMDDQNYLFAQGDWLSDRYNGYRSRDTATAGYGRQIWSGPVHTLNLEAGPGVRHDEYQQGGHTTKAIAYGSGTYSYKISDTAKFSEGVSVLANDDTTINSETALIVAINKSFSLKLAYDVTYNTKPPSSAPDKTDTVTSINLVYGL
ncbi:MAG: DUF481 domain-containing protein [Rouxiella aceris]|uniref:DUF481 domain-containing protein n=1 Tax=Rouxiella aceris TaxID=2703884 RepID=UPI00284F34B9|nr:DUF481 domain-containing protein [Rouxiella aceris]MDR3430987.1 DUF481 domain-containing protein [Rouxiella aceris]